MADTFRDKWAKLALAIIWLPVSTFIFAQVIPYFTELPILCFSDQIYESKIFGMAIFELRDRVALIAIAVFVLLYMFCEIRNVFRPLTSHILSHFRFGPLVAVIVFTIALIGYDWGMIEYSKYSIRSYVYNESSVMTDPDFVTHSNYRHWCGNGFIASLNHLYFETASAGFEDPDQYIRARSLLASNEVSNYLNGGDPRFDKALFNACSEDSVLVRDTAENLLNRRNSSCQTYTETFLKHHSDD